MEIHIREKCADCLGAGAVQHPLWKRFYEEHPGSVTAADVQFWFCQQGFRSPNLYPREEIECSSCHGEGVIEEWILVKELLKLLAAQT